MTLDDMNPTNTFEAQVLEVLRTGVVPAAPTDGTAAALDAIVDRLLKMESRICDLERKLEVFKTAIIEGAGHENQ